MKLGAHLSIAKGLPALLAEAESYGMTAIQAFARNPRGRGETAISDEDAAWFRSELQRRDWEFVIHAPYYVNLGSGTPNNRRIAKEVTHLDLEKGDRLGAAYVVVHLGSPGDGFTVEDGTANTIANVKTVLKQTKAKTKLLLETSAGPNRVGNRFEQLRQMLDGIGQPERVGICLDTCHLWVSGYDQRGSKMKLVIDEFDRVIGLDRLPVIHCNDTKSALGGGWDKHWHIGDGLIGREGFRRLMGDRRLRDKTFLLETPKEHPKTGAKNADQLNLKRLRTLAAAKRSA